MGETKNEKIRRIKHERGFWCPFMNKQCRDDCTLYQSTTFGRNCSFGDIKSIMQNMTAYLENISKGVIG
jgi:radical SAM superfamily enzyme